MKKIVNIAVIAHVDHGKTTLVDALLKQTHVFRANQEEMEKTQIMDSNELERERGITILAKNCSVTYKDTKINIIDTPGHADFSGEVERTLNMASGALLIVDAQEGPMPQTRVVLKKALDLGLKIIVVINKIDKKFARPKEVLTKVESLFLELVDNESQLEFPIVFAVGKLGAAFDQLPSDLHAKGAITPLLDKVIDYIPPSPAIKGAFKLSVSSIDFDPHLGRISVGRIHQGKITKGMKVIITDDPNTICTVNKIFVYAGLEKMEIDKASSGEIVALAGINDVVIGNTISDPSDLESLPSAFISKPTLSVNLGPNTSPFSGTEGEFSTARQIEARLEKELESNLSLKVKKLDSGKFTISGRGELHISILLETMRREGFEMEVGKPEVVITHMDSNKMEPMEEVSIVVPTQYVGVISEEFGKRHATLIKMEPINKSEMEFVYSASTRVLLGLRSMLTTLTKGTIVYNSVSTGVEKLGKEMPKSRRGVLVSSQTGESLAYGLQNAEGRGILFINPGAKVYEGMVVGSNSKNEDIYVNVCKGKKLTNMRSKSSDGVIQLTPATKLSLEQSLDFLERDELLEITPASLRIRKKHLTEIERKRARKG